MASPILFDPKLVNFPKPSVELSNASGVGTVREAYKSVVKLPSLTAKDFWIRPLCSILEEAFHLLNQVFESHHLVNRWYFMFEGIRIHSAFFQVSSLQRK